MGLRRDRELPGTALQTALLLLATGDAPAAEGELVRAIALQPDHPDLYLGLARARGAAGRLDEAREALRAALALRPGYAAALLDLARLELENGAPRRP